jgi:arylsulfatase A-like enzyme
MALLLCTIAISCTGHKDDQVPRNVIFIVVDTLRWDHLGCYGYSRGDSKTIDELARRGVRFTQARSSAPLTLPSFTSIFTSTYPLYHNVRRNESYTISDSVTTLAEVFKENGFKTKAVIGSIVLESRYGLDQGFDHYDDKLDKLPGPSNQKTRQQAVTGLAVKRRAKEVVKLAVDWLEEYSDDPFFLFLHFYDPHIPYDTPVKLRMEGYSPDEAMTWAYDSEIASVDRELATLMGTIVKLDLTGNTLVVFTSDHGEALLEHMEPSHGYFLYDNTIRVPMIFSCPGFIPQGKVLDGTVRTIDLMPTLFDFLDLDPPGGMQGISLKKQILNDLSPPEVDSYFETYYGRFFMGWSPLKGVQWNKWKYIQAPKPELYNLKEDPGELINLIEARPEIASSMEDRLKALISEYSNPSVEMTKSLPMDEEYRERLESLGYLTELADVEEPDSLLPDPKDMIEEYTRKQILMDRIRTSGDLIVEGRYDDCLVLLMGVEGAGDQQLTVHLHRAMAYVGKSKFELAEKELFTASDLAQPGEGQARVNEAKKYLDQIRSHGIN